MKALETLDMPRNKISARLSRSISKLENLYKEETQNHKTMETNRDFSSRLLHQPQPNPENPSFHETCEFLRTTKPRSQIADATYSHLVVTSLSLILFQ
ncbi:uncharacterized protein HKW66_Vig0115020 [Vigna angularis]|uniref:Uncharacterized protein n=1 Tax=Phaseolus angularis TaxID=3914 RepID=A0A8T0KW68_PHAAN|nr:uncharacterized protein HKW66_Vig0115020 [Vigna angularis]